MYAYMYKNHGFVTLIQLMNTCKPGYYYVIKVRRHARLQQKGYYIPSIYKIIYTQPYILYNTCLYSGSENNKVCAI